MRPVRNKPLVLIADDAPDTRLVLKALSKKRGYDAVEAADGVAALDIARAMRPDLILLDIRMPNMDGLTALSEIRDHDPSVSVVVISGETERELMDEALELGAVNFIHKPFDHDEIRFVLDRIYRAVEEEADARAVLDWIDRRSTELTFPSIPGVLSNVVAYLGRELVNAYPGHQVQLMQIKLALYEALANALEHGNLEITFEEKSEAMARPGGIDGLIRERSSDPRYRGRNIRVAVEYDLDAATYRIRDQGPGFNPHTQLQKKMADTNALHGRGIMLIRHYMDDVSWNESGNEIRIVAKFGPTEEDASQVATG